MAVRKKTSIFAAAMEELSLKEAAASQNTVSIFKIPFKGAAIVLLDHPASVTVYKYISVEALSGSASVFGYDINPSSSPLQFFSSEKTGLIEIKTLYNEDTWMKDYPDLRKKIYDLFQHKNETEKVMKNIKSFTVVIIVRRLPFPVNIDTLALYYPHVLEFDLHKKKKIEMLVVPQGENRPLFQFEENEENLASEVLKYSKGLKVPRVVVCGTKRTGKSSFLKYLLNRMLPVYPVALYLDTDPDQTEFGPPGTVSLTKITKPVIGPPFFHQEKPVKMMFTGSVSPSYLDMYKQSVSGLMDLYEKKSVYRKKPLFVNTMAMEGIGVQCLVNTIKAVKPTVLIEIVSENEASMFDYREYVAADCQYFQICCPHERTAPTNITAQEMRNFKVITHLSGGISEFLGAMLFNDMNPYCVPWKKIPIHICPGGSVSPSRMTEALSGSVVALCSVPESVITRDDVAEFPLLTNEPENECLAYGLVKAVDERKKQLFVVSPLKPTEWCKVNAIIKGDITLPKEVILKQEIYDTPLPYTFILSSDDEEVSEDDIEWQTSDKE